MFKPDRRKSDIGFNPVWEEITTVCRVCGSDFGEGPQDVLCLRVRLDHLAAAYECICLECARAIGWAIEEYDG